MGHKTADWWSRLRIQHKVWAVLLLLCVPLIAGLSTHLYLVQQLLTLQEQRHDLILAHEQVNLLRRLAVDIEDGFRGYLLTQRAPFLAPFTEAESKIDQALEDAKRALAATSGSAGMLTPIEHQLKEFLRSKHELIAEVQRGNAENALAYVRSGEGLRVSDRFRQELRSIEDHLEQRRERFNERGMALSKLTFVGLWIALAAVVVLGWISSRMLARSLTNPLGRLHSATAKIGTEVDTEGIAALLSTSPGSQDELGKLESAFLHMAKQIGEHVHELEALNTIGHDINTIGPDGLEGVLRRITDRAVELVGADTCMVFLRDERMGCWVVEAASGEWNERLKKSVMLWEELPVCVEAFETRSAATGNHFHSDERPQVLRRNLLGESMLAIPLLSQGTPFGVLSLCSRTPRPAHQWNQRLAKGLTQEAALAISNARLYEAAQQKQKRLLGRLRQLEHLAETLAHDLKGPGARMEELAKLLAEKFSGQIDERAAKWLKLLQENGKDIVERVEGILEVARVGTGLGSVSAVDPRLVVDAVLKSYAAEIEHLGAVVHVEPGFPLVACHAAYLRQIFDNLVSNALKYFRPGEAPVLKITSTTGRHMVCIAVQDLGIGIPTEHRQRVFQPFVRLHPADTRGSGIGLAIVQRIVALYGGQVWIEGEEGEGCTVKFTLPWLQSDLAGEPAQSSRIEVVDLPQNGML
ncbi:MAG TPA: ATP-binding protein [Nitrospira sp.]|nr:ATP-binding protein [Nitrospira sp.]